MDREQLLADLRSFGPVSERAATTHADRGDRELLTAILVSIVRDCGWEDIPDEKIAAFVRLADADIVLLLVGCLEGLDEAELEDDAGDVGDYFWRIQTSIRFILVGLGVSVVEPVQEALAQTANRFARECLSRSLADLGFKSEAAPGALAIGEL
jgi:hypothetical protein